MRRADNKTKGKVKINKEQLLLERVKLTEQYFLLWIWDKHCSQIQFEVAAQGLPLKEGQNGPGEMKGAFFKPKILHNWGMQIKKRIAEIDRQLNNGLKLVEFL